jgi:hypothetical protein
MRIAILAAVLLGALTPAPAAAAKRPHGIFMPIPRDAKPDLTPCWHPARGTPMMRGNRFC